MAKKDKEKQEFRKEGKGNLYSGVGFFFANDLLCISLMGYFHIYI